MVRRIIKIIAVMLLLPAVALAGVKWQESTPAQKLLKKYTDKINELLTEHDESPINTLFEIYPGFAVMGITMEDDAEIPETVEITVNLDYDSLDNLQLRVSEVSRFPVIAAAMIKALYGDAMTWEDALRIPTERAKKAAENPTDSFEEPVEELNGTMPRTYYAFYPNQYQNQVDWIQMTLIFPLAGTWDGEGLILGTQDDEKANMLPEEEADPDYDGYFSSDDYTHLEVFTTATPEPDSAAAEYDFR